MNRPTAQRRGFTLTEMLIVIGIIVLVLALSVPTFRLITGSRSVDAAYNQVSAFISRARTEAMAGQRTMGVAVYRDNASGRFVLAIVERKTFEPWVSGTPYAIGSYVSNGGNYWVCITTPPTSGSPVPANQAPAEGTYWTQFPTVEATTYSGILVDQASARDTVELPNGLAAAVVADGPLNSESPTPVRVRHLPVGVILFDSNGRLTVDSYRVCSSFVNASLTSGNAAIGLRDSQTVSWPLDPNTYRSGIGLYLFDADQFNATGASLADSDLTSWRDNQTAVRRWLGGDPSASTDAQRNGFGSAVMVNRYNGTLIRGE
jgi:prepilin-type N-terminal cleavage/methylation domain-containing protein